MTTTHDPTLLARLATEAAELRALVGQMQRERSCLLLALADARQEADALRARLEHALDWQALGQSVLTGVGKARRMSEETLAGGP